MDKNRMSGECPLQICFRQLAGYSLTHTADDEVILVDDLSRLTFHRSVELDFIALLFCTQGYIELDINDAHYYVGSNDVLYCNHGALIHNLSFQPDTKGKLLCVSWKYAERLLMRGTCRWESVLHARQYPLFHLQPCEQQLFRAYHQLFAAKVDNYCHTPESGADGIFLDFFQDLHRMVARHAEQWSRRGRSAASHRQDELFKLFMALLKDNYRQEHFLPFYADRLCVTPKYLTTVVKQVSGKSVSKWINAYLMDEIKSLLRNSNLTVSEIAGQLNFSNPSFFGKFVKARAGESPIGLRNTLRGQ